MAEQINSAMIPDERVCLVPVGYDIGVDGDPGCTIIEDANLPNPFTNNTRAVLTNPFGIDVPVNPTVELFVNNRWADPAGPVFASSTYGTKASLVIGEGVVVQSAAGYVMTQSNNGLGGHGSTGVVSSAPARVYVTRGKQ